MSQILPFIPNQLYKRSTIHDQFGGNRQSGICPSASVPYIFIFSGKSGSQFGYKDGWDNPNLFTYTGEGQIGDMSFTKGNLALRYHIAKGKRVFLFEYVQSSNVRFISELEFFDADYFETKDINKNKRVAIRFFFTRAGIRLPVSASELKGKANYNGQIDFNDYVPPDETERKGLVLTRVGHGAYRQRIIHRWEYQCAVTGFNKLEALIASHIVPWAESDDLERLDVNNGILLSPTYDALFDRHLISFDSKGKIILSDTIEKNAFNRVHVTGKEIISNLNTDNQLYLERHRLRLVLP